MNVSSLSVATFATNPQYRIRVTVIDKKEPGDKNIVLSLMQKPHQGNRKEISLHRTRLTIYKVFILNVLPLI